MKKDWVNKTSRQKPRTLNVCMIRSYIAFYEKPPYKIVHRSECLKSSCKKCGVCWYFNNGSLLIGRNCKSSLLPIVSFIFRCRKEKLFMLLFQLNGLNSKSMSVCDVQRWCAKPGPKNISLCRAISMLWMFMLLHVFKSNLHYQITAIKM